MINTADDYFVELYNYLESCYTSDGGDSDALHFYQYEEKPKSWKGCYIAINALPFVFGYALNDKNVINVNLHVPTLTDGTLDRNKMRYYKDFILKYIPVDGAYEEDGELSLELARYCITTISQPLKDVDNTNFLNFKIKVITHQ